MCDAKADGGRRCVCGERRNRVDRERRAAQRAETEAAQWWAKPADEPANEPTGEPVVDLSESDHEPSGEPADSEPSRPEWLARTLELVREAAHATGPRLRRLIWQIGHRVEARAEHLAGVRASDLDRQWAIDERAYYDGLAELDRQARAGEISWAEAAQLRARLDHRYTADWNRVVAGNRRLAKGYRQAAAEARKMGGHVSVEGAFAHRPTARAVQAAAANWPSTWLDQGLGVRRPDLGSDADTQRGIRVVEKAEREDRKARADWAAAAVPVSQTEIDEMGVIPGQPRTDWQRTGQNRWQSAVLAAHLEGGGSEICYEHVDTTRRPAGAAWRQVSHVTPDGETRLMWTRAITREDLRSEITDFDDEPELPRAANHLLAHQLVGQLPEVARAEQDWLASRPRPAVARHAAMAQNRPGIHQPLPAVGHRPVTEVIADSWTEMVVPRTGKPEPGWTRPAAAERVWLLGVISSMGPADVTNSESDEPQL